MTYKEYEARLNSLAEIRDVVIWDNRKSRRLYVAEIANFDYEELLEFGNNIIDGEITVPGGHESALVKLLDFVEKTSGVKRNLFNYF